MWKLLTVVIAEEMYNYLEQAKFFQKNKRDAKQDVVEKRIDY